ncbi:hypothetical protein [Streptomyces sp. NPDC005538]|uniref:hypothetical protein n=1 Tax=unclassified Streptomyces TaxID=2593676 RepID=UPI0033A68DDD
MASKTNTKGFSLPVILAVVAVIAALLLGGYFVWQRNKDDNKSNTNKTDSTSQSKQQEDKEDTGTTDPSEGGKYLYIKEWGVRFALPQSLRGDVEYGIRKNVLLNEYADDAAPLYGDVAYFASKELDAIQASPNNCGLQPGAHDDLNDRNDTSSYDGGPGVSLSRSSQSLGGPEYHLGNYWYQTGKGSAGTCYEGSDGVKEGNFIAGVLDALKSVESTQKN